MITFIHECVKGSPVHIAPACAGSREESDHFGSCVHSLSLHFYKRLFLRLEPMTSWSQGNSFIAAPGLPFFIHDCVTIRITNFQKKELLAFL
jgi:hypothetical protein